MVSTLLYKQLPILRRILASSAGLDFHRFFLKSIRDELDKLCRAFEEGDASELFEQVYLPVFDALALINEALGHRSIIAASVECALELLEELDRTLKSEQAAVAV